jgi:hypothetical protein
MACALALENVREKYYLPCKSYNVLAHYETALTKALNWIKASYNPVGIIVSGSIVRGNPNPNRDFDIYVVHTERYRQRVQKYFDGVPVEIFVNNTDHVHQYLETEKKNNRPVTAHLLSTGKIYLGEDNAGVLQLIQKAKQYLTEPVIVKPEQIIQQKYSIALLFEDATELLPEEPEAAQYVLDKAISEVITHVFAVNKKPLPRLKERLYELSDVNPVAGKLIANYYRATGITEKHQIAAKILAALQIPDKFFEWTSSKSE